jgi:hypothetical protein
LFVFAIASGDASLAGVLAPTFDVNSVNIAGKT